MEIGRNVLFRSAKAIVEDAFRRHAVERGLDSAAIAWQARLDLRLTEALLFNIDWREIGGTVADTRDSRDLKSSFPLCSPLKKSDGGIDNRQ